MHHYCPRVALPPSVQIRTVMMQWGPGFQRRSCMRINKHKLFDLCGSTTDIYLNSVEPLSTIGNLQASRDIPSTAEARLFQEHILYWYDCIDFECIIWRAQRCCHRQKLLEDRNVVQFSRSDWLRRRRFGRLQSGYIFRE
jgi:hypothetical protein